MDLAIRLLGPVELYQDEKALPAGGPIQRAVMAMLALRAGDPVAVNELVAGVWGEGDELPTSGRWLWAHISRIRGLLKDGDGQLTTVPGGYRLRSAGLTIDTRAFEQLLRVGREQLAAGDPASAATTLDRAEAQWRGPALMDLRDFPFAATVATHYDELRVDAAEERVEARLSLGEEHALIPELYSLVAEHPYRERLHGQLMLALYRAGRQAAALEAYQAARGRLAVDLGVAPGPELERLHRQILDQFDALLLPAAAAPASRPRTVGMASSRLPSAPTLFGRESQLDRLEGLAGHERLITLTGAGGSGKTVLALALVHRLLARFAHEAAFVDLAAVDRPDRVLPAIAAALGVVQRDAALGERLTQYLAERRMVVLLDNVEHVLEAADELSPLVDATIGLVVATSRSPLRLRAEHVVHVEPLPVPAPGDDAAEAMQQPAMRLFLHAADAAGGEVGRSPEELAAVGRICRTVDGLPLAIEIAAAQMRTETATELAERLADQLPNLRTRARDAPARQRTVGAAIGWSIDRLKPERRSQLSFLAAFHGSFSIAGAQSVCGMTREAAIGLLTELLEASLLIRQPAVAGAARFRILEPIRASARARAGAPELALAAARHAAFMQAEVDRLSPAATGIQRAQSLSVLRAEHADLLAALRHLGATDPDRSMLIVSQLEDYWQWTGQELEAKRLADELLTSGRLSKRTACRALIVSMLGAFQLGKPDEVRLLMDRALGMIGHVRDPATKAIVRQYEGRFGIWTGDYVRARAACQAGARLAGRAGDQRRLALCLAVRALADLDGPDAEIELRKAIRVARDGGMAFTEAWALSALSMWLHNRDPDEAMRVERSVLDRAREYQAPEAATLVMNNLAGHLLQRGSIEEARTTLLAALRSADRIGHRVRATGSVALLGEVEAARGHAEAARILLTAGIAEEARSGAAALTSAEEGRRRAVALAVVDQKLGEPAATAARVRGEAMTYREGVDYAFEINGVPSRAR